MIVKKLLERAEQILNGPLTLDKAILAHVIAHAGQEDKGQNAYIRHPLRVMEKMDCEDEMIPAVSHDGVEDTFLTLTDLSDLGYTNSQIKTIDALTKKEGETYEQRIAKVENSYVARKIKTADIKDNLEWWRLKNKDLHEKDFERMKNYVGALKRLGTLDRRD